MKVRDCCNGNKVALATSHSIIGIVPRDICGKFGLCTFSNYPTILISSCYSAELLLKRIKRAKNSSFIFTVWVKSVPRYDFKLAYVIVQMAVKEFFETHF